MLAAASPNKRNMDFQPVRSAGLQPADWEPAENISAGHTGHRPMCHHAHPTNGQRFFSRDCGIRITIAGGILVDRQPQLLKSSAKVAFDSSSSCSWFAHCASDG